MLDGTTGQNALAQAREFGEVADLTGIILTKMDGTAKGGIAVAIQSELKVPVKYIGVGETIDDLQKFDADQFVDALFDVKHEEESLDADAGSDADARLVCANDPLQTARRDTTEEPIPADDSMADTDDSMEKTDDGAEATDIVKEKKKFLFW